MDDEVASAITKDYQFSSDLEYVDEFADRMAAAKNHNTNKGWLG